MTTSRSRMVLSDKVQNTNEDTEYIIGGASYSSLLNYPVFIIKNNDASKFIAIKRIQVASASLSEVQVFLTLGTVLTTNSITAQYRYKNKKQGAVASVITSVRQAGEVTAADLGTSDFDSPLYTCHFLANTTVVIDLNDAPIMLGADATRTASIIILNRIANSWLNVTMDAKFS